jgi:hypothetical protein
MNKFKLILCVISVALMSGCATNAQNAALVGAIGGAIIATELNQPRQIFVSPQRTRPFTCYTQFIGRDALTGRAVYRQVCQ